METTVNGQERSMHSFWIIWIGQALSLLGSQLVQFALVWYVTESTGSATVLALGTLFALLPQIVLGSVAGALADRWNRKAVMITADLVVALATGILAALFISGMVQIWHIYVLVIVRSAGGAFHWAAMQASTVFLVPQKHLARVAGLNQSLNGAMNIISPLLGAFFVEAVPVQGVLSIDILTAILAVVPLLLVTIPQPEKRQADPAEPRSVWADVREGFDFVRSWRALLVMIGVAMLSNFLLHPAISLSPLMITEHFKGGAAEIALFQSASGLGIVLGGMVLGIWGGFKRRIVTALTMMLLMGASVIVIGLAPSGAFPAAALAIFIMMGANAIANGALTALFQVIVPPEIQGRFFALLISASSCVAPIGLAVAGPVTDAIGVQTWFVVSGVILGIAAAGAFFHSALKKLDVVPQPPAIRPSARSSPSDD